MHGYLPQRVKSRQPQKQKGPIPSTKQFYKDVMLDVLERLQYQLNKEMDPDLANEILQPLKSTWAKNMQATRFWEPNDFPPFRARPPNEVPPPPSPTRSGHQETPSPSPSQSSALPQQDQTILPSGRGVGMSDPSSTSEDDVTGWDDLLMVSQRPPDVDADGDVVPEEPELTDADGAEDVESLQVELDAPRNNYLVSRAMTVNYKQSAFHLKLSSAILHLHGQDELVDADGVVDFANPTRE